MRFDAALASCLLFASTLPSYVVYGSNKDETSRRQDSGDLILVMGMIRSGSRAVHEFFTCNGIKSAHYCCHNSDRAQFPCDKQACGSCVYHNLNASRPAFDNCGDGYAVHAQFDVEISDPFAWFLPQHYALPLLHDAYPASTWILNSRETPERWADSVLHWYSVTNRILNSFGHTYHEGAAASSTVGLEREVTVEALTRELDVSIRRANDYLAHERRRRLLVDLYVDHEQAVHDFAAQYGHPLLVLDVDSPTAGQVLQAFFAEKKLKPECWSFDGAALDNDWMDFRLQVPT
jgi:Sulfotransferase domain